MHSSAVRSEGQSPPDELLGQELFSAVPFSRCPEGRNNLYLCTPVSAKVMLLPVLFIPSFCSAWLHDKARNTILFPPMPG